jgi:hypothetical protein
MAVTTFDLAVHYEDGSTASVRADQRDMAGFELKHRIGVTRAMDELQTVFFRFIGWHALRRTGRLEQGETFEDWDARTVEVEPADADQESPDPGSPAVPAEA